jgi:alpha-glucosidase (family GH31 glycosyl hydrolase)
MNNYKDFTVDQENFRELITVSSNILTQFGIETILQIDATLSAEDRGTNVWYQDALEQDALLRSTIKQTLGHKALMQKSFAGDVVFLDFFNPNSTAIMKEGLEELQSQVVFRGLYIDHDEPAAFCNGEDLNGAPCGFIPVLGKEEAKPKTLL